MNNFSFSDGVFKDELLCKASASLNLFTSSIFGWNACISLSLTGRIYFTAVSIGDDSVGLSRYVTLVLLCFENLDSVLDIPWNTHLVFLNFTYSTLFPVFKRVFTSLLSGLGESASISSISLFEVKKYIVANFFLPRVGCFSLIQSHRRLYRALRTSERYLELFSIL